MKVNFVTSLYVNDRSGCESWDVVVEGGATNEKAATTLAAELNAREEEIAKVQAERDRLRAAVEAAMRVETLWLPPPREDDPHGECATLYKMKDLFTTALSAKGDSNE